MLKIKALNIARTSKLLGASRAILKRHIICRLSSSKAESFLSGSNANFLEAQYVDWAKKGPVDSSWDCFYKSINAPSLQVEEIEDEFTPKTIKLKDTSDKKEAMERIQLYLAVQGLIRSYQVRGHLLAKTDPLDMTIAAYWKLKCKKYELVPKSMEYELVARELGTVLCDKHMEMEFDLTGMSLIGGKEKMLSLREIKNRLENVYCGSIGVEYMHIHDIDAVNFIRERMETPGVMEKTPEHKKVIMRRLTKAVL